MMYRQQQRQQNHHLSLLLSHRCRSFSSSLSLSSVSSIQRRDSGAFVTSLIVRQHKRIQLLFYGSILLLLTVGLSFYTTVFVPIFAYTTTSIPIRSLTPTFSRIIIQNSHYSCSSRRSNIPNLYNQHTNYIHTPFMVGLSRHSFPSNYFQYRCYSRPSSLSFHKSSKAEMSTSSVTLQSSNSGSSSTSTNTETFLQTLSKAVSDALRNIDDDDDTNNDETAEVELVMSSTNAGSAGGSGASTFVVQDTKHNGTKYFVKSTSNTERNQLMMIGEYNSVLEIYNTNTIRVPKPIAFGNYIPGSRTFVIFEYLTFTGGGSQYELGQQLAQLHQVNSCTTATNSQPQTLYGFHVNNTIGATFQPNLPRKDKWVDFYIEHRLNHMLRLTNNVGMSNTDIDQLRKKVTDILQQHEPNVQPSLVHGDLWGGNKGFCYSSDTDSNRKTIVPCIFDPASYYGDREVDIALTYVFGGFTNDFYRGYNDVYPLSPGHEQRRTIYNLYHILNHDVLFGGGYASQARNMIYEILRM